jgi:POT family proton-dependent oligopeptide transporter
MITLLALFLIAPPGRGGLGWDGSRAILVAGFASGTIQLMVPLGGFVLDRWMRAAKHIGTAGIAATITGLLALVLLSGLTMAAGSSLPFEALLLWFGIAGVAVGNGLFKPAIALAVSHAGIDPQKGRDASFTRFWLGIQIGVLASMLFAGTLANYFDWVAAFVVTMAGPIVAIILWTRARITFDSGPQRDAANSPRTLSARDDRSRLIVILLVCGMFALYFAGLSQVFGLLPVLFETQGDRDLLGFTVPTAWISASETAIIVLLTPFVAGLWSRLNAAGREPNSLAKFALGMLFLAAGFLLLGYGALTMERIPLALSILVVMMIGMSEIPLQPIGLSLVSGLASPRLKGRAIGLWYLGSAAGGFVAGLIGAAANRGTPGQALLAMAGLFVGCAVLLWLASRHYADLLDTRLSPIRQDGPALRPAET